MYPSWDMAHGSQGIAHHHEYLPGLLGAMNVNVVLLGVVADPAGIVWLISWLPPREEEVKEWGIVS